VPAIFLLTGNHDTKSWFLALYVPAPWVVVVAMAALGVSMYTYGGLTYLRAKPARDGSAVAAAE
jgi:ABC-2 type transport system permease protein